MTRLAAFLLFTCIALPAWAQQSPTDLDVLKKYTGSWSVGCAKPAGVRLTVDTQALTLSAGNRQLRTGAPLSAFSYFGKQVPPAGFDVALLGDAQPTSLSLLAMSDAAGPYLRIDADAPLNQQFGKSALAGKFRRCP